MGANISRMMAKIFGTKEMRLLMLGLDAAGKTSMRVEDIWNTGAWTNTSLRDSHSLQAQAESRSHNNTHSRLVMFRAL